jgi:hypothetical protein
MFREAYQEQGEDACIDAFPFLFSAYFLLIKQKKQAT